MGISDDGILLNGSPSDAPGLDGNGKLPIFCDSDRFAFSSHCFGSGGRGVGLVIANPFCHAHKAGVAFLVSSSCHRGGIDDGAVAMD